MEEHTGRGRSIALGVLAVVAAGVALRLAAEVLVPIAISLLLFALFRPLVRRLQRWHVPATLSAIALVLGLVGLLFGIGAAFAQPLQEWTELAPKSIAAARTKLEGVARKFPFSTFGGGSSSAGAQGSSGGAAGQPSTGGASGAQPHPRSSGLPAAAQRSAGSAAAGGANRAGEAPAGGAGVNGGGGAGASGGGGGGASGDGGKSPMMGVLAKVFGTTASLISTAVEVLLLLCFLLAAGDRLRDKVKKAIHGAGDRATAVQVAEEIEAVVSRYVVATALINLGQGLVVGLVMWALGMPTPALWGLMTFIVEFIPYLGAMVVITLLTLVGLATFGNLGHALIAPASYLAITTLQNNLVSPIAYGRGLKLSPAVILVAVMVWWFLWGVAGAVVAVPVVAAVKVLADHVPALNGLGELLGE
jgi:predicted PurR-regulated permease PerM